MQVQQKCLTKLYLPFVRENCASLRPPSGEHPVRSVSSSSPPRTRLRWASRRFKRQNLCFLRLKCFPQCCFISAIFPDRALCCLAFTFVSLCSVFKVQSHIQGRSPESTGDTIACTLKIEQCKKREGLTWEVTQGLWPCEVSLERR